MNPFARLAALAAACILPLTGCDTLVGLAPVGSLQLSPDSVELAEGETTRLSVTLKNEDGAALRSRKLLWESSDSAVVTVDPYGRLRGVGPGIARVTATANGQTDSIQVRVFLTYRAAAAGAEQSCAIRRNGQLYCWGARTDGSAGAPPVRVDTARSNERLSLAGGHACALTDYGRVVCWGQNQWGQLGDGTQKRRGRPEAVVGNQRFAQVSAGWTHTCALTPEGKAYCWGDNRFGQLGTDAVEERCTADTGGQSPCSTLPVEVSGNLRFGSISAGSEHTCAVASSGKAYCWGSNVHRQLGTDSSQVRFPTPQAVPSELSFHSLSAGQMHTCALTESGHAYCWGDNTVGQLGDGSGRERRSPVGVAGAVTFRALDAGSRHTCALSTDGTIYCWGENLEGRVGIPPARTFCSTSIMSPCARSPVRVSSEHVFFSVSAGHRHTCATTLRDRVYCWGDNRSFQLGSSAEWARPASSVPVEVSG